MEKFKCLCCDFETEFESAEAAYKAGWDVPPYFTIHPLCDLCPASEVVISGLAIAREKHREAHERWAKDGRPKEFEWPSNAPPKEQVIDLVNMFLQKMFKE